MICSNHQNIDKMLRSSVTSPHLATPSSHRGMCTQLRAFPVSTTHRIRGSIVRFKTDDEEVDVQAPKPKKEVTSRKGAESPAGNKAAEAPMHAKPTSTLQTPRLSLMAEIGLAVCFPALSLLGAAAYSQVKWASSR